MKLTRREFGLASSLTALGTLANPTLAAQSRRTPWHERVHRWSQLNMTADDVIEYDLAFWRDYWKATRTQGVIISAGGQIAFYPTALANQKRAANLGNRDLFGDLAKAARDDGLEVVARLSLRGAPELIDQHPEWMNVDVNGKRLTSPCMNGGYFYKYGTDIVREVAQRYRPSGFTASGWGPNYGLCYCAICTEGFRKATGQALPRKRDWDDPVFRSWMQWNSDQVVALWDHCNLAAKEAGGPDCLWIGQLIGSMLSRSLKRLADHAPFMMIDHQSSQDESGFADNSLFGKTLNGLVDWKKPITVATAFYEPRLTSPQQPDLNLWMAEGMAGGARPWWNVIGAYSEDKRRYAMLPPLLQWHDRNERYLFNRRPIANVGIVWSETNNVYYGRESFVERVKEPYEGMVKALVRARIPYVVVHADNIDRDAASLAGLILPNLAAMTDTQIASVRRFAAQGGGVLATGQTSLYDRYGDPRTDLGLSDLFGAHAVGQPLRHLATRGVSHDMLVQLQSKQMDSAGAYFPIGLMEAISTPQTFLRLTPELRSQGYGPRRSDEPAANATGERHAALRGFAGTDIMYFGGMLDQVRAAPGTEVLLTFIPQVPTANPEDAVFKVRRTDVPGLLVREGPNGGGRVAYLPAELDRLYERLNHPDHANLLANLVRWTTKDTVPLKVEADGLFDFNLYRQPTRLIIHIANLSNSAVWRGPVDAVVPSGALDLTVKLPMDVKARSARLLVAGQSVSVTQNEGWTMCRVPTVLTHEVIVIE
jgi:hypothetical protein